MILLLGIFYISALLLALLCIFTANNMSRVTCDCLRACLLLVVAGLACLVCSVFYCPPKWYTLTPMLPIMWGLTGWLLFDRYRAHEDIDLLREFVLMQIFYLKEWINGR